MKREAQAQTALGRMIKAFGGPIGHVELKQTKTDVFRTNVFEDHQLTNMLALEQGPLYWKWSDEDSRKKPCDSSMIPPLPAYIGIKFPKCYVLIRIGDYMEISKGKKSITLQEAKSVAERIFN